MKLFRYLSVIGACWLGSSALKAQVSIDGILGSEWTGVTPVSVLFDSGAPLGNFGAPSNTNHLIGYEISLRSDASFVYVGLQATSLGTAANAALFANLYFDTNPPSNGSDLGFEIGAITQRAFLPGVAGYVNSPLSVVFLSGTASSPAVMEAALPINYFTTNVLFPGFPLATSAVQLRLSQSFGYSVAGGASYGSTRLGQIAIPEPSTYALIFGFCVSSFVALRRFRAKSVN